MNQEKFKSGTKLGPKAIWTKRPNKWLGWTGENRCSGLITTAVVKFPLLR